MRREQCGATLSGGLAVLAHPVVTWKGLGGAGASPPANRQSPLAGAAAVAAAPRWPWWGDACRGRCCRWQRCRQPWPSPGCAWLVAGLPQQHAKPPGPSPVPQRRRGSSTVGAECRRRAPHPPLFLISPHTPTRARDPCPHAPAARPPPPPPAPPGTHAAGEPPLPPSTRSTSPTACHPTFPPPPPPSPPPPSPLHPPRNRGSGGGGPGQPPRPPGQRPLPHQVTAGTQTPITPPHPSSPTPSTPPLPAPPPPPCRSSLPGPAPTHPLPAVAAAPPPLAAPAPAPPHPPR